MVDAMDTGMSTCVEVHEEAVKAFYIINFSIEL